MFTDVTARMWATRVLRRLRMIERVRKSNVYQALVSLAAADLITFASIPRPPIDEISDINLSRAAFGEHVERWRAALWTTLRSYYGDTDEELENWSGAGT